jgi:acetate kinase
MPIKKKDSLLVINSGSSGIKFTLLGWVNGRQSTALIGRGQIRIAEQGIEIRFEDNSGEQFEPETALSRFPTIDSSEAIPRLIRWIEDHYAELTINAIGHRVVHGGAKFLSPVRISATVLAELEELIPLAPLHQPACLQAIRLTQKQWPQAEQVACFDTAFHSEQSWVARALGLPRDITDLGVQRYGFHGLSMEYISAQLLRVLGEKANGKIIVAHLGSGSSLCAIKDGKSVSSTMGFSVLDGLLMGTRCGSLDPGVVLYLMQHLKMTGKQISNLLYERSGLLGVSGISADMQVLLESKDPKAAQAVELFMYRLLGEIGSLAAALGGLDTLIFTGGMGENSAAIRERVVNGCAWLGATLDPLANRVDLELIHGPTSALQIAVIATNEEQMIALHTASLLNRLPSISEQ